MTRRLVTISFTGLNASGGVPKFNRDLHAAFNDRTCIHYCWDDYPFSQSPDVMFLSEWDKARMLNGYLLKSRSVTHDDVVVADGFWAWGLESLPLAISHSHGIWGHVTWKDVQRGNEPENPFHHAAQIAFRGTWTRLNKPLTAVSDFIAENMNALWGFNAHVINNGVDTDLWKPAKKKLKRRCEFIIHGVNDRGNVNKGWDHIEEVTRYCGGADVLTLDEYAAEWCVTKPEALAQADLVVHPSGYEGNSMFIAEALACGIPVVGYDVGYLYTAKKHGHETVYGRILDRDWRSPWETAKAVKEVLYDSEPALLEWMGKQARVTAENNLSMKWFRKNWRSYVDGLEQDHGA